MIGIKQADGISNIVWPLRKHLSKIFGRKYPKMGRRIDFCSFIMYVM